MSQESARPMTLRVRQVFFLSIYLLAACSNESRPTTHVLSGNTMGTTFNITIVTPPANADLKDLSIRIQEKLEHIENIASTYRSDSELSLFNTSPSTNWISATDEFCEMISATLKVSAETYGAFDVTVGPLVNLWGFGPLLQQPDLPSDEEISAAKARVGYLNLQTDCEKKRLRKWLPETELDLSGWAKGYAVDEVAQLLDGEQVLNYLVEIGGELRARGHNDEAKKFAIAIEKPAPGNKLNYTVVRLSDVSVATSGDYRNFFVHEGRRYSHTIDPRTGRPVSHQLTSVTVVGDSAAYADAMATALLVLGPGDGHALAEELGIAAYFVVQNDNDIEEISSSRFERLRQQ